MAAVTCSYLCMGTVVLWLLIGARLTALVRLVGLMVLLMRRGLDVGVLVGTLPFIGPEVDGSGLTLYGLMVAPVWLLSLVLLMYCVLGLSLGLGLGLGLVGGWCLGLGLCVALTVMVALVVTTGFTLYGLASEAPTGLGRGVGEGLGGLVWRWLRCWWCWFVACVVVVALRFTWDVGCACVCLRGSVRFCSWAKLL